MPHILTISRSQTPALPEAGCWPVTSLDFMQPPLWRKHGHVDAQDAQAEYININSTLPRKNLGYSPISSYKNDAMLLFTAT